MDNLIFSLNATVPIFLMMLLGLFLRKIGWIDLKFADKMNSLVFKIGLPVLVFHDLAEVDFAEAWNFRFAAFCFLVTVISILISGAVAFLWKDKTIRGEYIQASYRSSAALLGIAFIQNIYGSSVMGPLMIIASVPLYNIMAVVVLSIFKPENIGRKIDGALIKKTLIGVIKNPILIGIVIGLVWSMLSIPVPAFLSKTTGSIGGIACPMGLMAMGAAFDFRKAFSVGRQSVVAALTKTFGYCLVFLPIAALLGFHGDQMAAILIMLGSPTTVACYVMARNMGHDGTLTSSTIMLTTLLSAFSLTMWVFLLKTFSLL